MLAALATMGLGGSLIVAAAPATATHGDAALPYSNFEIDLDANLKVDDAPKTDWAGLAEGPAPGGPEIRAVDEPTGANDDSYAGSAKENTVCPGEVTGSIPNNKSDLLTFHVNEEPGVGGAGYLNLAWSRVSEPSGTTLMSFEFNQSETPCAVGPNLLRTVGDLLIEYEIDQGGAQAMIFYRTWGGSAWSNRIDITNTHCDDGAGGTNQCAVGTINTSMIPVAESDGIATVDKQPRTFGEAQIDLDLIFSPDDCVSFGSAMLKSRASDSLTAQMKDFIAPVPIDLQNCGNVIIRKQTLPDGATAEFGYTKSFGTDPVSPDTFTLSDDGVQNYEDTVLFGTGYTVVEDTIPDGWQFKSLDCSASTGVTPIVNGATVTFDIDSDADVLDCTYTNEALAALTFVKDAQRPGVSFDYATSGGLDPDQFSLADGENQAYSDLSLGTYGATETVPDGWNLESQNCDNGDTADAVTLEAGDDVTCTFVNVVERGAIVVSKMAKHAAAGEDVPVEGVTFTVTNATNGTDVSGQTGANGSVCFDGLPVSILDGDYTVTETVPEGYANDSAVQVVTVLESTCADGDGVVASFDNIPLTNVTVSVDSQIDGGTASVIECTRSDGQDPVTTDNTTDPVTGDGSLTVADLRPTDPAVTLTCTVIVDP